MNFSILTIGDEVCIGQIVNTNASWIADKLSSIGLEAQYHSAIADNKDLILDELERLYNSSDVLVITGGLGPTHDDKTKDALISFFNDSLILDKNILNYIEDLFKTRKRELTEINKEQALVPSKCIPLKNNVGTAPGILYNLNSKLLIALPGVPSEMKSIFENEFLPIIIKYFEDNSKEIQLFMTITSARIFESDLAELIGSPEYFPKGASLAYLPAAGKVRLRIGAKADTKGRAEDILNSMNDFVIQKAGKFIIAYGNGSIQSLVAKLLIEKGATVAVAESCTGGMLGASFTSLGGSSEYFLGGIISYSNEVKNLFLDVKSDTLNNFGAVSEQTAIEMAHNAREKFQSDYALSITGIAGPSGGSSEKPVGTVWIGLSDKNNTFAKMFIFGKDRSQNRERAVTNALLMLKERILEK